MSKLTIRAASIALAVAASAVSSYGQAKNQFPSEIRKDIPGMTRQPQCNLCHLDDKTGGGTVVTPFGWSMKARGLTGSTNTVAPAIAQMIKDGVDSDGDGVTDIEELKNGTDPNSAADVYLDETKPGYGCGGTPPVGRGMAGWGFVVLALGGAGSALRRRR
jgi:hypothetical protein